MLRHGNRFLLLLVPNKLFPVTRKTVRVTKKRGKTAIIITASPYKNELEKTIKKKEAGG
jgi:phosphoserine phosphatase